MSRAFVREDDHDPGQEYRLPAPDSPYYREASAWALIQGADIGDSRSAERATGFRWGDPLLTGEVQAILERAESEGQDRVAQLARRFLRAAKG